MSGSQWDSTVYEANTIAHITKMSGVIQRVKYTTMIRHVEIIGYNSQKMCM